jgi:hypothetical protein
VSIVPKHPNASVTYVNENCGMELHPGEGIYLADLCSVRRLDRTLYTGMRLLGKTLRYTVEHSGADCGCVAAVYLTDMRARDHPECEDNYCDANPKISGCGNCAEIDIQESNLHSFRSTLHSAGDGLGGTIGYGGGGGSDWAPGLYGVGGRCVDTRKPFDVAAHFSPAGMSVLLSQKGSPCELPLNIMSYSGVPEIAAKLADGTMTLIMTYWFSPDMAWLDGPGKDGATPCNSDTCNCRGPVRFSGFSIDGQPDNAEGWPFELPYDKGNTKDYGADRDCISTGDVRGYQKLMREEHKQHQKLMREEHKQHLEAAVKEQEKRHQSALQSAVARACGTGRLEEVARAVREARAGGLGEGALHDAVSLMTRLRLQRPRYVLNLVLYNLDYRALASNPQLRSRFEAAVKRALAAETGGVANPDCVTLGLLPGTLPEAAQIRVDASPASQEEPRPLLEKLRASRERLGETVAAHVRQVEGIRRASLGAISGSYLDSLQVYKPSVARAEFPLGLCIAGTCLAMVLAGLAAAAGLWAKTVRKVEVGGYTQADGAW